MDNIKREMIIKKDALREISYGLSDSLYTWCKRNKIKVEEPRCKKSGLYETFVIKLETPEQHLLFSAKWMKSLKLPITQVTL